MPKDLFPHLNETQIRQELRGFPESTVNAVLRLQRCPDEDGLEEAILGILAFYLPQGSEKDLTGKPSTARLREDLGVDSLTFTEAAYKIEELFSTRIENAELAQITTIADLKRFARAKFLDDSTATSS